MAAQLTPEQREFQEQARRWLAENPAPEPPVRLPLTPLEVMYEAQRDYLQEWQGRCYEAGLVGSDIPREYGGHGHEGCQRLANQELSRAGAPFLINVVGLSMAVPTILVHGTEEQKKKFIPGALSGEEIWCQGFSEPGAGSDMANQQTSAVRQGDDWIVNGHKVWTSLGHFAKWMILITRTSKDHKYDGLTYFLCPIEGHPGVTVRPLIKITGETGFNEVLFEDTVVPDAIPARRGREGMDRRDDHAHVRAGRRRGRRRRHGRRRRTLTTEPSDRVSRKREPLRNGGAGRLGRPAGARRDRPPG